ncbi:unnamed protein product [Caenorhabditis angaria]|uniref:BTB domain-containing protein n=1 Tax=Caenorhabditis angaria TaxID=860376 RepID=A0A9P1IM06_9PELO|nr:unnamed protein product [Caenorhabditis angaria]
MSEDISDQMNPTLANDKLLQWKFENIKELDDKIRFSQIFTIENLSWKIGISRKIGDIIEIYFTFCPPSIKNYVCDVNADVKLVQRKFAGVTLRMEKENGSGTYFYGSYKSNCISPCYSMDLENIIKNGYYFPDKDMIVVNVKLSFKYFDFSKRIEDYTDTILCLKDTDYHCNRGLLCSNSKRCADNLLSEKFLSRYIEKVIIDNDVKRGHFALFLASMHSYSIDVNESNYIPLMKMADKFDCPLLKKKCEKVYIDTVLFQMCYKTTIQTLKYIEKYDLYRSLGHIVERVNFLCDKELLLSDEFKTLRTDFQIVLLETACKRWEYHLFHNMKRIPRNKNKE